MKHLTAGEKGNPAMDAQKYREQRIVEAHTASKLMGAQNCIVLKHPDGELQACQVQVLTISRNTCRKRSWKCVT